MKKIFVYIFLFVLLSLVFLYLFKKYESYKFYKSKDFYTYRLGIKQYTRMFQNVFFRDPNDLEDFSSFLNHDSAFFKDFQLDFNKLPQRFTSIEFKKSGKYLIISNSKLNNNILLKTIQSHKISFVRYLLKRNISFVDTVYSNNKSLCNIDDYYFYKNGYLDDDKQVFLEFISLVKLYNNKNFKVTHIKPKDTSTIWMKGIYKQERLFNISPVCDKFSPAFDTSKVYEDLRELLSSSYFCKYIDSVYFPLANRIPSKTH